MPATRNRKGWLTVPALRSGLKETEAWVEGSRAQVLELRATEAGFVVTHSRGVVGQPLVLVADYRNPNIDLAREKFVELRTRNKPTSD